MKNTYRISMVLTLMFMSLVCLVSMRPADQKPAEPWEVPEEYKNMENPVKADEASLRAGKLDYTRYCGSCHGRTGKGDGVKARGLETFPGDLTGEAYQSQTDGEHFYKSKFGRGEMPSYEDQLEDQEIWNIVNHMRTFAQ